MSATAAITKYLEKALKHYSSTAEEKQVAELLFNNNIQGLALGDQRLNFLAALSYNAQVCEKIFAMLEKAISPTEYPWGVLHKALLIIHTLTLYGSELAVDKCVYICRFIHGLQEYNSALLPKKSFSFGLSFNTGGMGKFPFRLC